GGFRQRVEMRLPSPVVHEGILAGAASGSPFARRAAERGERVALVGELSKIDGAASVHLRPVRTDARKLVWIELEVAEVPSGEELLRRVREAIHTSGAVDEDLVEVRVRGTLHPDARMDHPDLARPEKLFHGRVEVIRVHAERNVVAAQSGVLQKVMVAVGVSLDQADQRSAAVEEVFDSGLLVFAFGDFESEDLGVKLERRFQVADAERRVIDRNTCGRIVVYG
ncbi:MAG: hypothetical protein AAB284_00795, partial [Chloroflexota bacterium]